MSKGRKITVAVVLVIVIIAAIFVILRMTNIAGKTESVTGTYQMTVVEGDTEILLSITFDDGTMTYEQKMEVQGETLTVDSGTYAVEDGKVQIFSETDDINSLVYTIEENGISVEDKHFEKIEE